MAHIYRSPVRIVLPEAPFVRFFNHVVQSNLRPEDGYLVAVGPKRGRMDLR